ncbi:MAG: DUF1232 domain-containing protein [Anaerolineales bacterium]|nr:MAG: DUF1232 domain-containing protein [Anaerolineales bacterium]
MANKKKVVRVGEAAGIMAEIIKNIKLIWRLLNDRRVSPGLKMIVPATLLYLLFPVDIIPDIVPGLGQLDDIAVILLGLKLFVEMCPKEIVRQHLDELTSMASPWRVVEEDETPEAEPSRYIEAPYQVVDEKEEE